MKWVLTILTGIFPLLASSASLPVREAWSRSNVHGTPDAPKPYVAEQVFAGLELNQIVEMVPFEGRLYAYEKSGKVWSFPERANPGKPHLFANLGLDKPQGHGFGMAFHPKWREQPFVFLTYMTQRIGGENRLSKFRFTVQSGVPVMDKDSEEILLTWASGGHYGGCLRFGPEDGLLYLSTGDGTPPNPPDSLDTGQDNSDLHSCILRINVDKPGKGRPYHVPEDNPYLGFDKVRPEIWAFGFRQPWKMSFDRRGRLWVGEVGWELWEMIHLVERGGNYGWSAMEASNPVKPGLASTLAPISPPIAAHPHTEAASITGGFEYSGTRLPGLQGAYVYGDYETGILWAIRHDGQKVARHDLIADTPHKISTFALGNEGELYYVHYGEQSEIYRLVPNPKVGQASAFPKKLSGTGLFDCTASQDPAKGVYGFEIHEPMWEDGATARRFIALPGESSIKTEYKYRDNGTFRVTTTWPEGAVLARTVQLGKVPVETQLLHFDGNAWAAYSYQWNGSGTDAELVAAEGAEVEVPADLWEGGSHYRISSRAECMRCHNMWNKFTPAFDPLQLSGFTQFPRQPAREVAGRLGLANPLFFHKDEAKGQLVNSRGRKGSLEHKARSWLHANCAHCHRRHGGGTAPLELNYDRTLSESFTLWMSPTRGDFGLENPRTLVPSQPWRSVLNYRISTIGNGHMPPISSREVDTHGAKLLWNWVSKLPAESPSESTPGNLDSPSSAMQLAHRLATAELEDAELVKLAQPGLDSKNHNIRALFERFRSPGERPIPAKLDPGRLFTLQGNPENGATLLSPTGKLASCLACHKVNGQGVGQLGPDLAGVGKRLNLHQLFESLSKPSATIVPEYRMWNILLKTGGATAGFLAKEEAGTLTLRLPTGQLQEIPTQDIRARQPLPHSLMPEGLIDLLEEQETADLLAYLQQL